MLQVDVIDLVTILECLGLKVNTIQPTDGPPDPDGKGGNTVTVVCNYSGLRVVLNSSSSVCTCPRAKEDQGCSWQVSGCSQGVLRESTETGNSILASIPETTKKIITQDLQKIIQYSRAHSGEYLLPTPRKSLQRCTLFGDQDPGNMVASYTDLIISPVDDESRKLKLDTPPRYRSLDTLTNQLSARRSLEDLPSPGPLVAKPVKSDTSDTIEDLPPKSQYKMKRSFSRQDTYTVHKNRDANEMVRSRTSSPIGRMSDSIIQELASAEQVANQLRNKLTHLLKEITADDKPDDSVPSLTLDVSKISVCKPEHDTKTSDKHRSSPNLSQLKRGHSTSTLKQANSKSTSQLALRQKVPPVRIPTRMKKLSPNFKNKELVATSSGDGVFRKLDEKKGERSHSKIATPVLRSRLSIGSGYRTPTNVKQETPTSLSTSKKKAYANVKSTIPKPAFVAKKD